MITVEELRKSGLKVRVIHIRHAKTMKKLDGGLVQVMAERGGKTVVQVRTPEGDELEGTALCSTLDNYNRRLGLKIALGRALMGQVFVEVVVSDVRAGAT